MESINFFTSKEIKHLRKSVDWPSKARKGWRKSQVEPTKVLENFPVLHLKKGFILRAYQFISDGGGNAVVWAMPKDAPFPEPSICPKSEDVFLDPPCPPMALGDIMEAIDSDGSPWSYMSASVFLREIKEFGACWHGCSWSTHEIIDETPSDYFNNNQNNTGQDAKLNRVGELTWIEKPKEWRPSVEMNDDNVKVTFYTFSGLGSEAVYRNIDTFKIGSYSFKTETVSIADGGGGYVF